MAGWALLSARDQHFRRDLAAKCLNEKFHDSPEALRRFYREAQICARLQHPGIIPVYGFGWKDGCPFFTMKLVDGRNLSDLLKQRSDASDERMRFLRIFLDVCEAVAYAHSHQTIHRDLKPGNVMVGEFGEVLVIDWGLAKKMGKPSDSSFDHQPVEEDEACAELGGCEVDEGESLPPKTAAGRST